MRFGQTLGQASERDARDGRLLRHRCRAEGAGGSTFDATVEGACWANGSAWTATPGDDRMQPGLTGLPEVTAKANIIAHSPPKIFVLMGVGGFLRSRVARLRHGAPWIIDPPVMQRMTARWDDEERQEGWESEEALYGGRCQ